MAHSLLRIAVVRQLQIGCFEASWSNKEETHRHVNTV